MNLIQADETQLAFIKKEDTYRPPDRLEEDVTRLIEWMSKQPHLPEITDRAWLSNFITGCKFSLQKAKQVIESYFIVRAKHPEFLGSFTRERLEEFEKFATVTLFPKPTPEGNRVYCTKTNPTTDEYEFDVMLFCQVSLAVIDLQLKEEPMYGNIALYDLKHIQFSQFMAFTPTITKNLISISVAAFPLRVKSIHFINPPKFISRMVMFFKMFLPTKIRDRLYVHDNLEDLYQYVPKECLPDVHGGTVGKMGEMEANMRKHLLANKDWLATRPVAELTKIPAGHEKRDELDMSGTFKKLQID